MKFPKLLQLNQSKMWFMKNPLEMILFVLFIVYLILPIATPKVLSPYIDSALGISIIFALILFMFFYSHPLLAILFVFVAYELVRRSSWVTGRTAYIQYTPTQQKKDAEMRAMNPPQELTLEQDMVAKMAPQRTVGSDSLETSFKPVASKPIYSVSAV